MIKWQIKKKNIDELIGYDKNPRKFTGKGLKDLKASRWENLTGQKAVLING